MLRKELLEDLELKKPKLSPSNITVFGSARTPSKEPIYQRVKALCALLASEGFNIITGGGFGLMGAANEGAFGLSKSTGINIKLPHEQSPNPFTDELFTYKTFPLRKQALFDASSIFIFTPGGFGTLDELFEALTLKQTGFRPDALIVLYGEEFWRPMDDFLQCCVKGAGMIDDEDLHLIIDDDLKLVKACQEHRAVTFGNS